MSDIGALALVKFEYTDGSGWKVRPGLITGEHLNDYQITFITKQVDKYRQEDTSVIIDGSVTFLENKFLIHWLMQKSFEAQGFLKTRQKFMLRQLPG